MTALSPATTTRTGSRDRALSARASAVTPGGMYGHLNRANFPAGLPAVLQARGRGTRLWDVDDNEYIDLMCSWGPMILGYANPIVDAAYQSQLAQGDVLNGPGPAMVELAELMVDTVAHADWALFSKNGTDATTLCVTIARAATGRKKVLKFTNAYHGAAPLVHTVRPTASPPRTAPTSSSSPSTTWPGPKRPRPSSTATSRRSSRRPTGTTRSSTRSCRAPSSPAACGRWPTGSGLR